MCSSAKLSATGLAIVGRRSFGTRIARERHQFGLAYRLGDQIAGV